MRALAVVCVCGALAFACGSSGSGVHRIEDPEGPPAPTPQPPPVPPPSAVSLQRLTVAIEGAGQVRSEPAGIDCPRSCSADFAAGSRIVLTATPDPDWAFDAFAGACASARCQVILSADASVLTRFRRGAAALSIAFAGSGSGRVVSTPAGLDCPGACTATFAAGTQVRLAASPGVLSRFGGWAGPCKGAECTTTLHSDAAAVARFELRRYAVTVVGRGPSIASTISPHLGLVAGADMIPYAPDAEFFWDGALHYLGMAWPTDIRGINDSGTIVGVHDVSPDFRGYRWVRGLVTDLGTLGGSSSWADAINADGVAVGWAELPNHRTHAAIWSDVTPVDLGAIDPAHCDFSEAHGINAQGVVVGESCVVNALHPVRFRRDGLIDDLGSWGGHYGRAAAVNDAGAIVGVATGPDDTAQHGFIWTEATSLRDVGTLPGLDNSDLACINSAGVAVGISFDRADTVRRGIVWGEDRLIDLDDLVPGGWAIDSASCIDEAGRIAATAVMDDGPRAVLLTPE